MENKTKNLLILIVTSVIVVALACSTFILGIKINEKMNKLAEVETKLQTYEAQINAIPKTHTVIFKADGIEKYSTKVEEGKKLDYLPAVVEKLNYTGAWNYNNQTITQDTTITMIYTAKEYSISYVMWDVMGYRELEDSEVSKFLLQNKTLPATYTCESPINVQNDIISKIDTSKYIYDSNTGEYVHSDDYGYYFASSIRWTFESNTNETFDYPSENEEIATSQNSYGNVVVYVLMSHCS